MKMAITWKEIRENGSKRLCMASKPNLAKSICRRVCAADVLLMCCNFAANCGHTYFCIILSYSVSFVLPPYRISYFWSKKSCYLRFYPAPLEKRLKFQKIPENQIFDIFSSHFSKIPRCSWMFSSFFYRFKNILNVYESRGNIDVRVQVEEKEWLKVNGTNMGQLILPAS